MQRRLSIVLAGCVAGVEITKGSVMKDGLGWLRKKDIWITLSGGVNCPETKKETLTLAKKLASEYPDFSIYVKIGNALFDYRKGELRPFDENSKVMSHFFCKFPSR